MSDPLLTLREYARLAPWNIRDLSSLAGGILESSNVTPINAAAQSRPSDRTIRFYVTRHLMSAPDGRGTAATYGYKHLLQLLAIKLRQMEGSTLVAIAKDLQESTGDVLEKRIAAALGSIPAPMELDFERGRTRGRVARALGTAARRAGAAAGPNGAVGAAPESLEPGAWYRVSVDEGAEIALRYDHPGARTANVRRRVAEAVSRALRESAAAEE